MLEDGSSEGRKVGRSEGQRDRGTEGRRDGRSEGQKVRGSEGQKVRRSEGQRVRGTDAQRDGNNDNCDFKCRTLKGAPTTAFHFFTLW